MKIYEMLLANAMGESGGGGGGGSSDFSTAQVTIINNSSSSSLIMSVPNLFMGEMYSYLNKADITGDVQEIVLYKGKCTAMVTYSNTGVALSCTGDITISGLSAIITGDGTITISDNI